MKKKSIAAVLISTLIVSCLAGCGQKGDGKQEGTDKADSVKVGVSIFNKDQFFANQEKEMLAYAENFPELEITSFDAQNDMQKQQEHIRTFASQNYDAIILSAVNTDTAA